VTKVQVRRGRIETGLYAKRYARLSRLLEAILEVGDANNFGCAFFEQV
jgi:hypothetical protein